MKERCEAGALRVLSFGEGQPIRLSSLLPPMLVVPPESATPEFGTFHWLPDIDHINVRARYVRMTAVELRNRTLDDVGDLWTFHWAPNIDHIKKRAIREDKEDYMTTSCTSVVIWVCTSRIHHVLVSR